MVLTFTGSLSIAQAGHEDVRTMLIGALGCNFVWGIIDGVLFLMGAAADHSRDLAIFRALRNSSHPEQSRRLIADALPSVIASTLTPDELETMRRRLADLPTPPERQPLTREAWLGAIAVFVLVFVSTMPVVVPFVLIPNAVRALRVSNAIAVVMLFITGYAFARMTGRSGWLMGTAMVLLGATLASLTIALGG